MYIGITQIVGYFKYILIKWEAVLMDKGYIVTQKVHNRSVREFQDE